MIDYYPVPFFKRNKIVTLKKMPGEDNRNSDSIFPLLYFFWFKQPDILIKTTGILVTVTRHFFSVKIKSPKCTFKL